MSLSPEFLDDLRARTGLAAIVGRRVKLTRAGREWKGCCPFHNEKTPSFYVNEDKGFYHCFGCGVHGDAIRFLMEQEGLAFLDAVRTLAAEAGMEVPEPTRRDPEAEKRAGLYDLLAAAARWFEVELASARGANARRYLERRGVPLERQRAFGLGFAPDSRTALSTALLTAFPDCTAEMLAAAGLQGVSESGSRYDRFRGRLMFPIHDTRGRVIGFGGRALADIEPKYLNSAEGPVFAKRRILYNLHRAAPAARKSGRLLIVEGYMDVIGLDRAGIAEAVAPLGTALTEEQMALAWRLVDEPILAFDGDSAGMRAGTRAALAALPLLQAGKSLRFLALPKGRDPDDVVREGGRPAMEELVGRAQPLEPFLFDAETSAAPVDTPERRTALRRRLMDVAATIADPDLRRDYQRSWGRRFDALISPLFRSEGQRPFQLRRGWRPGKPGEAFAPPLRQETRGAGSADERILGMLLASFAHRPDAVADHAEALAALPLRSAALTRLRNALLDGQPREALPRGVKPLWPADLPDDEFDRRARDALASLIELHHIEAQLEQTPGECLNDDQLVSEQKRRSLLGSARAKAIERLVAHAVNGDNV